MPRKEKLKTVVSKSSSYNPKWQINEQKISLKHGEFDLITKAEKDNRLKPEQDIRFWLEHSDGDYLGDNPIRIATELKISPVDASRLFKKKLNELKSFHEGVVKIINGKLERIETVYSDAQLTCDSMRLDYSAGKGIPEFQNHLLNCQGCYNWFVKRVQSGDFHTQTILEEVKKTRQKRRKKKQEENYKQWKKKQQGEGTKE